MKYLFDETCSNLPNVTLNVKGGSEAEFPSLVPILEWDGHGQENGSQPDQDEADQLRPSRRSGRNGTFGFSNEKEKLRIFDFV